METREELIAGLREAISLLQQTEAIMAQQDALVAQLTPPKPYVPEKKPIQGGKTVLLWVIVGAIDGFVLMPLLWGALVTGYLSSVPVASVSNSDATNAALGAMSVLFILSLVIWIVGSIVIKRAWNKRVAKKNATVIAEQNRAIAAENAMRKPQDAAIYEQLDALEAKMLPIRKEWEADVASWYPKDYTSVKDATELLHLVENHRANTMTEAINVYETIQHQLRMEQSQAQIIQQQEEMKRNQRMQIFLQGVTAAASIQGAASAAKTADHVGVIRGDFDHAAGRDRTLNKYI